MEINPIAHIETDFNTKFGVPRQSGMLCATTGRIVFEPPYRNVEALRGLEDYDYIWLLWDFSEAHREGWSPTVRPPRLGGNVRMGVFATRSPFRPNNIGLSSVRLLGIDYSAANAPVIIVESPDLMNGTPIYDIKPYLSYTDCHPEARGGFTGGRAHGEGEKLRVVIPPRVEALFSPHKLEALREVLSADPRPRYIEDPDRVYGFSFAGHEVKFKVEGDMVVVI
ncbi:MAG: tRNA (N6-threonylcarbamoyladenosine(37)-N6)-methyltransferase TrmO [Prevotellaceae bacterium]|nr:tRNA (N6-threonylcarbamoyladenosine(37)-N6)-methyltransferase TrmO [Prevotellaceae bacterium]